jgi:hypothetical protein
MPKVKISLKHIITQIDQASEKLLVAGRKAKTNVEKKKVAGKIKELTKIKKLVRIACKNGLTITVPTI